MSQPLDIGGHKSFMKVDVMDGMAYEKSGIVLRWLISIVCENNVYDVTYQEVPGARSLNRIEKGDYSIPDDFKNILSTFKCFPKEKVSSKKSNHG